MNRLRATDIKYLRGIGPRRADLLKKHLGITTYYDLLHHFPTTYVDRSTLHPISSFTGEMPQVQVKGRFFAMSVQGEGAKTRLVGLFTDGTSQMEVVWFNRIKALRESVIQGKEYILFGKPTFFNGRWSMVHPEIETEATIQADGSQGGFRGVYSIPEPLRNNGFTSRSISLAIREMLSHISSLEETLPPWVMARMNLLDLRSSIGAVHNPPDMATLEKARFRLKFEELFYLQLDILRYSRRRKEITPGFHFSKIGYYFNTFYTRFLPFPLTDAQKRVVREVRADVGSGRQMNRLVQGDVGSGKTIVALLCMLMGLDNGTQACLMAPTEILATQHFETLHALVAPMGVNIRLLTGSTPPKARREIHASLTDGTLHILVGTHAVIEDKVEFKNLGIVVIDEQHRFGVEQRARLWRKNIIAPHVLVMTATPIPRTLAMTVYGDLDVSVIDQLPPGRKPVKTMLRYEESRFDTLCGIGRQLKQGRQVYIVYPLVKENDKLDLKSLEEGYESIRETFKDYKVAYVHGQMKPAEKDYQMQLFASGEANILVATTVIEVGVNVPNATTMLIENAERFGLSQLHQLRGRVGRGEGQSFCILMSKRNIASTTRRRLELMTETTDGFVIAEADMHMRGPGDIEGTMQSGLALDLHIANLTTDSQILSLARELASETLDADPTLSAPDNVILRRELSRQHNRLIDWSRIS